jgi:hypothetical protein
MSFFSSIESAAHTFAAWAEKELGKLSTEAPTIEAIADTTLQYVGGAASVIAGLEGGPAASAGVVSATTAIKSGVTALSGLIADFGATPTAASIATSLATNASALISAAQIKNPASVTAANAIVSNLTTLATVLTTASPAPSATA